MNIKTKIWIARTVLVLLLVGVPFAVGYGALEGDLGILAILGTLFLGGFFIAVVFACLGSLEAKR